MTPKYLLLLGAFNSKVSKLLGALLQMNEKLKETKEMEQIGSPSDSRLRDVTWFTTSRKSRSPSTFSVLCICSLHFSCSVVSSVYNPMDCRTPGFPVHHQLLELTQTHVHWVDDDIQPSHPLSSLSLPAFNLSQHQGLFQWVNSSHRVAKVLELQLHHQSFQWIFRTDFL